MRRTLLAIALLLCTAPASAEMQARPDVGADDAAELEQDRGLRFVDHICGIDADEQRDRGDGERKRTHQLPALPDSGVTTVVPSVVAFAGGAASGGGRLMRFLPPLPSMTFGVSLSTLSIVSM